MYVYLPQSIKHEELILANVTMSTLIYLTKFSMCISLRKKSLTDLSKSNLTYNICASSTTKSVTEDKPNVKNVHLVDYLGRLFYATMYKAKFTRKQTCMVITMNEWRSDLAECHKKNCSR